MNTIRVLFAPIESDPPHTVVLPFLAEVVYEDEQSPPPLGLRFRLTITNQSEESLCLNNPYESVSYQITNSEGWPITVSPPPRSAKLHPSRRSPQAKATYLALTEADLQGKSLTVETAVESKIFELQPEGILTLGLEVNHIIVYGEGNTIPLPAKADQYTLNILLPLSWMMDHENQSVILQSMDKLTIHLV